MSKQNDRYIKQVRFSPVGEEGQRRLHEASVGVLGCGALGALVAEQLVRAGVGRVRLIDRDFVELSNLQRQVLYTEQDAAERLPKAVAAETHLRAINSEVTLETRVSDFTADNADSLLEGLILVVDGTDNLETRYLLNEVCLDRSIPWVYGGCLGATGQAMLFHPPATPCLRCLFPEAPPVGSAETCDTAGVIGPAAHAVSSVQSALAMQCLVAGAEAVPTKLTVLDLWSLTFRSVSVGGAGSCDTCRGDRPYRSGRQGGGTSVLCGRNAVQITPPADTAAAFETLQAKLAGLGPLVTNNFLLRWDPPDEELSMTVFRDGRAIIQGTDDAAVARAFYSRHVGN